MFISYLSVAPRTSDNFGRTHALLAALSDTCVNQTAGEYPAPLRSRSQNSESGALSPFGIRRWTENLTRLVCWLECPAPPSIPTVHTLSPPLPSILLSATTETSKSTTVNCALPLVTSKPFSVGPRYSAPTSPPPS